MVALVERKFQILGAQRVVAIADGLGREDESEWAVAGRVELLGASGTYRAGPRFKSTVKKKFHSGAIERHRNFNRRFKMILADRSIPEDSINFLLGLGVSQIFGLASYVL